MEKVRYEVPIDDYLYREFNKDRSINSFFKASRVGKCMQLIDEYFLEVRGEITKDGWKDYYLSKINRENLVQASNFIKEKYQIDLITEDQQGVYRIEATHFPTDASGSSLVALDVAQLIQVDLPSLEKVLISSGFSFEDTEAQVGVFGSDVRSTDQAFEGNKSAKTAFAYPDIKFTDAFPDPEAMYYMWSWRSYNSGSFQYHTFFGIRDVLNGAGFDIKTASTANILFFGSSGGQSIGTDTSVQNTWNHYYIQIHWVDGNQQRPEISLWINGALVGNVTISASTPYSPPAGTNAALGDFRVARGNNTIGGTKYYDFCLGGTADNPLVPMNQSTIVPADIESALEAAIPGGLTPPPAKVFRFNPSGDPANAASKG